MSLSCLAVCICVCTSTGERLESSNEDLATAVNLAAAADTRTN